MNLLAQKLNLSKAIKSDLIVLYLVIFLTFILYWQTIKFGFLEWDDNLNIYNNSILLSGNWFKFWTEVYKGMYIPITYSMWTGLYWLGDGTADVFRFFNLAVHSINVILFYYIIKKNNLLQTKLQIFLALSVFALHPLQVESVAWVTGGKDLLSSMFALSAVLVISHRPKGFAWNFMAMFLFVLGLLCKPSIAALPVIIFGIQILLRPKDWKPLTIKIFMWSIPVLIITYLTLNDQSAVTNAQPLVMRFLIAIHAMGFYIIKTLLPISLSADYGLNPNYVINSFLSQILYFLAAIMALILSIILYLKNKLTNLLIILMSAWVIWMLPVLGIIPFAFQEYSTVADRYLYLSLVLMSVILSNLLVNIYFFSKKINIGLICVFVTGLTATTYQRISVWQNNETFYNDMYIKNNNSYSANMGLGQLEYNKMHYDNAWIYFSNALNIRPGDVGTIDKLLKTKIKLNDFSAVLKMEKDIITDNFEKIIQIRNVVAGNILSSLGYAHLKTGDIELSSHYYCWVSRINPDDLSYYDNLNIVNKYLAEKKISYACDTKTKWIDFVRYRKSIKN